MATRALATAFVNIVPGTSDLEAYLKGKLRSDAAGAGMPAGQALGTEAANGFKKNFILGGIIAGAVSSATTMAIVAIGGLAKSALDASDATSKFKKTLDFAGIDNKTIETLTKQTQKYADQTVYDLQTIQNTTAQLAANGVPNYEKLTEAAGNLNAVAGGSQDTFSSVAMVLTQTAGAGKLTTENWNQLANAIPGASGVLQKALADNGAYTGNFRKAMEEGQITADEFNQALMEVGTDPIAVEAAKSTDTFEGSLGNLQATITGEFTTALNDAKTPITNAINSLTDFVKTIPDTLKQIKDWAQQNKDWIIVLAGTITALLLPVIVSWITSTIFGWALTTAAAITGAATQIVQAYKVVGAWIVMGAQAVIAAGLTVWSWVLMAASALMNVASIVLAGLAVVAGWVEMAIAATVNAAIVVGGWVVMATQSLIQAARMAAAWFIALGPVGWAIAIVVALVALIIANWDTVVKVTGEVWANVTKFTQDAWNAIVKWFGTALQWLVDLFLNWTLLGQIIKNWDAITKAFTGAWNGIVKWFGGALSAFGDGWNSMWQGMGDFVGTVFKNIVGFVKAPLNAIIDLINGAISAVNSIHISIPDWVPGIGGGTLGFNIGKIPHLADGGLINQPTTALIGEAGPEVVTPLKDFERMLGIDGNGSGKTIIYNAAPNQSLSSDQALFDAMRRAKVLAGW